MSATLLDKRTVAARIGVHPETVMRLVREGRFPAPVRFAANARPRWPSAIIDAWIDTLCTERRS